MAFEISEGGAVGALHIKDTELKAAISGGAKWWAVEKNLINAMEKIHKGIKDSIGTGERDFYLQVFDPKTKGKKVGKHGWNTRVTAAIHGYSAALAIKNWWSSAHGESKNLKPSDKCYFTGGAWDSEIKFLQVSYNGWADYNSSDLIVKKGSCFYGVSLKKKDMYTSANPPMINKSIIKLLETLDDNSAVAKALSKLKTAKAKYFGGIIHEAWSGPLKGTTGIGKVEDEFYTSIRHPKDGKGWISFIDMKGPGSFKFENTVIGKEKDEDTGIIYDTFKYYITGVEGNKIICGNTEPDKTKQKAILENDVIQKAFGLGEYDSRTLWKTRSFVNSRLGNKNTFFGIVTDLLSKSDVAEEVGELLLDSILKTSLASEAAGAIQKKKCSNCHFAFSLVTAIGKYDPKNTKITEGDVKENPVIQSVISSLVKDNNNAKWFIAEDKILAELKRTEATDAGREPPAKLFFTIGIQGNKGSAHNVLNLQVRYKGTFSPWPQFLGEMSDEFIQMLKDNKKQFKFTSDCGK